jgi:DNA-binding response OmpR family regulator
VATGGAGWTQSVHSRHTDPKQPRSTVAVVDPQEVHLRIDDDGAWLDGRHLELSERELAMLLALSNRRVTTRRQLSQAAGLQDQSVRRCDSILVGLRRHLPDSAIRNVRSRGWLLEIPIQDARTVSQNA